MRYLIVQDWDNTHGNHAGMVHMCRLLCERYPEKYKMFVKDVPTLTKISGSGLIWRIRQHLATISDRRRFAKEYMQLCAPLFKELKNGDEVFLLEFHLEHVSQYELAKYLRKNYPFVRLYGLTHLTPLWFDSHMGSGKMIRRWSSLLDKQLTLGSTLSSYLEKIGVPKDKISTGFHYVDRDYYNGDVKSLKNPITVITIGALQRDFQLLSDIVKNNEDVNWVICKGRKNIDNLFSGMQNVILVGYVEEGELRKYMSISDLSLNVLEDTVGSNVITTSMAMGLGIIVSNVGSIHDYCDDSNAVFCDNTAESFTNEIKKLTNNNEKVLTMRKNSKEKSALFAINRVNDWFNTLKN